jgi:hypothetical protein
VPRFTALAHPLYLSSLAFKRHPLQAAPRREGICENGDRHEISDRLALTLLMLAASILFVVAVVFCSDLTHRRLCGLAWHSLFDLTVVLTMQEDRAPEGACTCAGAFHGAFSEKPEVRQARHQAAS